MKKYFFSTFLAIFCWINTTSASGFKLDAIQLEQKFENAVEVSLNDFSAPISLEKDVRVVNKNVVALSAVFCGTLGLHRYLLGHNESAKGHLIRTGISLSSVLAGVIIFASSSSAKTFDNEIGMMLIGSFFILTGGIYVVAQEVFVIFEGLIYLVTPKERFNAKNGLRYDPRYFAAFKYHEIEDAN